MQIILNYKSYYEAFSIGVIDSGYTAVAELLFYPLFKDKTLLDDTGKPFEVDNQNASSWAHGSKPIQSEIQRAIDTPAMLDDYIKYFNNIVVPGNLSSAKQDEMLDAIVELVNNCDLSDKKKTTFLNYYEQGLIGEFLARLFQRALLGNNKVAPAKSKISASQSKIESVDEFNALVSGKYKKPKTIVPKTISKKEKMGYVGQMFLVYEQTSGKHVEKREDLIPLNFIDHFEMQRRCYYMAETINRKLRDSIRKDEDDCFEILKEEIEIGIDREVRKKYPTPLDRVDAITDKAGSMPISRNTEKVMYNWIGPGEKKGVCHMLVNDNRLKWVEKNGN